METISDYKPFLQEYARTRLTKSKSGLYCCPICGSGTRGTRDSDGALSIKGDAWKCFSCDAGGDLLDLIQAVENIGNQSDALKRARELYGNPDSRPQRATGAEFVAKRGNDTPSAENAPTRDYRPFLRLCAEQITRTDYRRGISLETLQRFGVGLYTGGPEKNALIACNGGNHKAPIVWQHPAIVIPYGTPDGYFATRYIGDAPPAGSPHLKITGQPEPIFNESALDQAAPVWICEAPLDALSIIDAGGQAIAIGGSNMGQLQAAMQRRKELPPLIIATDNDEPGEKKRAKIREMLDQLNKAATDARLSAGRHKDANAYLQIEPDNFKAEIAETAAAAIKEAQSAREKELQEYLATSTGARIKAFLQENGTATAEAISTGLEGLDKLLDGGLYPGLYFIGAISSLGKTTFCLQVADRIAAGGNDVLFFSLEQGEFELMAKSISRTTYELSGEQKGKAKTARKLTAKSGWADFTRSDYNHIMRACEKYKHTTKDRLYIIEGVGNIGVEQVKERVLEHIRQTGRKPVIVIDYLQILAPYDPRSTDKQNTDKAVLELKRLSRDHGLPVIGISSFNRDNYTAPVNMASFKESGAIEYSSDVLIGLQYSGMDYQEGEADKSREKRVRDMVRKNEKIGRDGGSIEIELKILKNRNGTKGEVPLLFCPMFSYYKEKDESWANEAAATDDYADLGDIFSR